MRQTFECIPEGVMLSNRDLSKGEKALPITVAYESSPQETFAQVAWALGLGFVCNLTPSEGLPKILHTIVQAARATQHNTTLLITISS